MDCLECMALASALHDGEDVDDATSAAFSQHLSSCGGCSAFVEGLITLETIPAPVPPEGAVDRLLAALAAAAASEPDLAETPDGGAGGALTPELMSGSLPSAASWLTRTRLWTATGAVGLSAAAIVIAVVVSQQVTSRSADERMAAEAIQRALTSPPPAGSVAPGAGANVTADKAAAKAPPCVAFAGAVYRAGEPAAMPASELTTAGAITTALDGTSDPTGLTAFRWSRDRQPLIVALPTGGLQTFVPVVRRMGGVAYQLQTGSPLSRYGEWPRLPAGLSEPSAADGSPTFRAAGSDDLGVPVFVRIGDSAGQGIAVAPGTAAADPAAGNPWWTWWAPLP